ncbi:MAG TPA: CsbD family protein [Herpetosiphonaceae bacterium]|jgi:uncharacterized protein YjbJ (UPF0337 family)|nr:CsbD family protein [Herpetosiphonaceae bacterium]
MSSGTGDKISGKADELKGNVKQGVGGATGDTDMQSEGQMDTAKGKAEGAMGGLKNAASNAGDALSDAADSVTGKD